MENQEKYVEAADLAQMKSELASLKYILSEKLQVEDRGIRQAMTGRQRDIDRRASRVLALGVVAMGFVPWSLGLRFELSVAFIIATEWILLMSGVLTVLWHRPLRRLDFATADLVQAAEIVGRFRQRYASWPKIGLPIAVGWFVWLMLEIYRSGGDTTMVLAVGCGCLFGGVVGALCGLRINREMVSDADEMLAGIAELRN